MIIVLSCLVVFVLLVVTATHRRVNEDEVTEDVRSIVLDPSWKLCSYGGMKNASDIHFFLGQASKLGGLTLTPRVLLRIQSSSI